MVDGSPSKNIQIAIQARASQVAQVVNSPPANAEDLGSIPGSGRSPGGGNGHPLQYLCLGNPMDRGTWRAAVHRAAKSQAQLKRLSTQPTQARATVAGVGHGTERGKDSAAARPGDNAGFELRT